MAAGLGFKTFTTGEVLTAADTNGYLMQGILVFASAAARDAAITSPQEGQACYLKDTNQVLTYSGSAWVAVGGGSPLTTKGDVYGFSTVDARIPIGANNTVLTADSTQSLGLKWAAPAGGGKVLQVVSATTTTATTIASTTLTDTGITATITPTLNTSKILVLINYQMGATRSTSEFYIGAQLLRDATTISNYGTSFLNGMYVSSSILTQNQTTGGVSIYDAPATTSALTYKLQARVATTSDSASITFQFSSAPSTITLLEIGA